MTMEQWAKAFEGRDHAGPWIIGLDHVGDERVSTVWLGLNHNWMPGPPLIFETMIFGHTYDGYQRRYSTKEQAAEAHRQIVANLRLGLAPDESWGEENKP
jgi:hypothetical protein